MNKYNASQACNETFKSESQLDSTRVNWNNIKLFRFDVEALETPEHVPGEHAIIVVHKPLDIQRRLGGELRQEQVYPDRNIIINPVGVPQSAKWTQTASFSMIFLDPILTSQLYYEEIDPDRTEILPHFSQTDPVINSLSVSLEQYLDPTQANRLYAESVSVILGLHLIRNYGANKKKLIITPNSKECLTHQERQIILDYLQANLHRDLSLLSLATLVKKSVGYFGRCFVGSFGLSPCKYIQDMRLNRAAQILKLNSGLSVLQVAAMVGMNTTNLYKQFRLKFKVSPAIYKNS